MSVHIRSMLLCKCRDMLYHKEEEKEEEEESGIGEGFHWN